MGNDTSTASEHPKGARSRRRITGQMLQNVLLIWLDDKIDENNADCRNTISQLRSVVHGTHTFTDSDQCIHFLQNIETNKACMIISDSLAQHIVPRVHQMPQVDTIFIFCDDKKHYEQWTKDWTKIKGIFTEITPICQTLKQVAQQCEQNAISISVAVTNNGDASKKNFDQLDPSFMYTQIIKEILLTIKFEPKHFTQFIDYCREALADNPRELVNLDQLEQRYRLETPVWWYTYECFLYPMLNRALRVMDVDLIVTLGFFIGDLHRHITQLHKKQFGFMKSKKSFTVYRGQGMAEEAFDKLTNAKGGLVSFNNFLSTSKISEISLGFAQSATTNPDLIGVLFVMAIDPSQSTTPFASVNEVGYFGDKEDEVLFSTHAVFRIDDITPMEENHKVFQINLTLTSDKDEDLRRLMNHIQKTIPWHVKGWDRLASVLLDMGQYDKAQEVFEILLDQTTSRSEEAAIYNQLGITKVHQEEYEEGIRFYEKSLEINQKLLSANHPSLAACYNNIAGVYHRLGDYPKALIYSQKDLEITQKKLRSNHPQLASSFNNIGLLYSNIGEYASALSFYEKALQIKQRSLPSNHPSLALSYDNIGLLYEKMGKYSEALSYCQRALEIAEQSLPSNHPDLQECQKNFDRVKKKL